MLAACEVLLPERHSDQIRLLNRTDRALVAIAFAKGESALIDPNPALRAEEFETQKVRIGQSVRLEQISGYDPGDDLLIFLYARTDLVPQHIAERYGPDAAPLAKMEAVTARELREQGYLVVIRDLSR